MKVFGQLERAQAENVAADTTPGIKGRLEFNTVDGLLKVDDGAAIRKVVTETNTQTLSNKTLTVPVIASFDNGAAATITSPTEAGTLPTKDGANFLQNAAGATFIEQGSDPSSPASGKASLYFKTDGKLYKKTPDGTVTEVGSGAGGINYIGVGDAETNSTSSFAGYDDGASSRPVDGTGGTATGLTLTTTGTNPLRGTYSFQLAKDAANRQGKGESIPFTIHRQDRNKVLVVETEIELVSGTYVGGTSSTDSDLIVYLYDVTNGVLIEPTGFRIDPGVAGNNAKVISTFQTSSSVSYRLIYHVATTSAAAWTLNFEVKCGPQTVQYGAPITDALAYTPTFVGLGTVTGIEVYRRRIGDRLHVFGNFTTGTATAVASSMSLPPGLSTADVSIIPSIKRVGSGSGDNATGGVNKNISLLASAGATTIGFSLNSDGGAVSPLAVQNGSTVFFNSTKYSFEFAVEIAGWSSSVQMSNDADTRVVGMKAGLTSNLAVTLNTPFKYDTVVFDTHGAYSSSTGLYTAAIAGKYLVSITGLQTVGAAANMYVAVNGSNKTYLTGCFNGAISSGSALVDIKAGDTIAIQPDVTQTFAGNASFYNTLNIQRLSGPSAIAASEFVAASYGLAANVAVTIGNPVKADTKIHDTHGAYSVATGFFTCPVAGYYKVSSAGLTTGATTSLQVLKNSVGQAYFATINNSLLLGGAFTIKCVAGDTLAVTVNVNSTLIGTAGPGYDTWVSFEKVG